MKYNSTIKEQNSKIYNSYLPLLKTKLFLICLSYMCVHVCVSACSCTYEHTPVSKQVHVVLKEQPIGISALLPPHKLQGSESVAFTHGVTSPATFF